MSGWAAKASQTAKARDALCELVNIGSGNALTSLTHLLGGGRISLQVPDFAAAQDAGGLPGLAAEGIVVRMDVAGAVGLTFLAAFESASALRLAQILLAADGPPEALGENEESAILEAVNILSCSFLGALSRLVHGVLVPSPPRARYGRLAQLVRSEVEKPEETMALSSGFEDAKGGFAGRIVVLVGAEAASRMLEAVGVAA